MAPAHVRDNMSHNDHVTDTLLHDLEFLGSCLDWLEKFRKRCDVEQVWVRRFCEAEEFSFQGLSEIGNVYRGMILLIIIGLADFLAAVTINDCLIVVTFYFQD